MVHDAGKASGWQRFILVHGECRLLMQWLWFAVDDVHGHRQTAADPAETDAPNSQLVGTEADGATRRSNQRQSGDTKPARSSWSPNAHAWWDWRSVHMDSHPQTETFEAQTCSIWVLDSTHAWTTSAYLLVPMKIWTNFLRSMGLSMSMHRILTKMMTWMHG